MSGWVKIYRRMLDWEWYGDPPVVTLFVHLLLAANYKPKSWRGRVIEKGQLVIGRVALSKVTGLSQQQIRTALEKLKSTSDITIEATNQFSIITLVNWDKYQDADEAPTSEQPAKQPTNNQQSTTTKEINNINKSPNGDINTPTRAKKAERLPDDWVLPAAWGHWAIENSVLNEQTIRREAEIFGDYWRAKAGQESRKLDWFATWRNWIRRKENDVTKPPADQIGKRPGRTGTSNHQSTGNGSGFGGRQSQTEQHSERTRSIIARREEAERAKNQANGASAEPIDHAARSMLPDPAQVR